MTWINFNCVQCGLSPGFCQCNRGSFQPVGGATFKWPPDPVDALTDADVEKVAAEVLRLLEERLGPLNELAKALLGKAP